MNVKDIKLFLSVDAYYAIEELCESRYGVHLDLPRGVSAEKRGGVLALCVSEAKSKT